jgi:TetR/AcrR family transcriptional regulator, copper-responsive repressor
MSSTGKRRGRPPSFDRNAALDAAVELFWRHGYEGASIAMLTEAMGVAPPTLYAAFGSKPALYREAMARYAGGGPRDRPASPGSAYDTVRQFLHAAADQFTRPGRPRGCMVASGSLRCGLDAKDAVDTAAVLRSNAFARFVGELEKARGAGELAATADPTAMARFYMAVLQGMSVQAIDGADAEALHAIVDAALAAWPAGSGPGTSAP